jgi:hypothetical protein
MNREPVAQGMLLDGRRFTVSNVTYSAPIRGLGDKSVVVEIDARGTLAQETIGFGSVEDATNYLQSTDVREYNVFDEYGNETVVKRQGMGVPDGLIKQLVEQNPEQGQTEQGPATQPATVPTGTTETGRNDPKQAPDTNTLTNRSQPTTDGGPAENF